MEEDKITDLIKKENTKRIEAASSKIDKVLSEAERKIFEEYKYDEEATRKLKPTLKDIADGNNFLLKWCIHEAYIAGFIAGKTKGD